MNCNGNEDYRRVTISFKCAADKDLIELIDRTDNVSRLVRDALRAFRDQVSVQDTLHQLGRQLAELRRAMVGQFPHTEPAEREETVEALDSILGKIRV